MLKRARFFVLVLLLVPCIVLAEIKTYTHTVKQAFGGSQSPDDARVGAIMKAKHEVLEKAGTYLESLTIVRDFRLSKDEVHALAAGILKSEIVSQNNYATRDAFGIVVEAKVAVDTAILDARIKKLLNDQALLNKYKESQKQVKLLLAKIDQLEIENKDVAKASKKRKQELKQKYRRATQQLSAVEWNQKALGLWRRGRYSNPKKAIQYLNKAIKLDPEYEAAYVNRGNAFSHIGKQKDAIRDYTKAIELQPKIAESYNNRGNAYRKTGQFEKAIDDFDEAIDLNSKYAAAYGNRGLTYKQMGRYERAIKDYNRAIKLAPTSPSVYTIYINRGIAYKNIGEFDRALADYNKAVELRPKNARVYANRGMVLKAMERQDKACDDFRKACRMGICDYYKLNKSRGYCK